MPGSGQGLCQTLRVKSFKKVTQRWLCIQAGVAAGIISRAALATGCAADLILGTRAGQGLETNTAGTGAL